MYTDISLTCADCQAPFTFTAGEQEFHASKGFANKPGRCPDCRAARKRSQGGDSNRGSGGGGGAFNSFARQMHPATCAQCGKETEVPFAPTGARPVYCRDCFSQQGGGGGGRRNDRGGGGFGGGGGRNRY